MHASDAWAFGNVTLPIFAAGAAAEWARSGAVALNDDFVRVFGVVYGGLAGHLRRRGWLNRTRASFIDEPSGDGFTRAAAARVNLLLKQSLGAPVVAYSNSIALIDLPAVRPRSYLWWIWGTNRNGTGIQGWGSEVGYYGSSLCAASAANKWAANPWLGGNSARTSSGAIEPAGYTSLLYPPRAGTDHPAAFVPSIRWEMLRLGAADAARLSQLDALASRCRADASCAAARAAALRAAGAVIARVRDVVWGTPPTIEAVRPADTAADHPYSTNVTLMHDVLDGAAAAIIDLTR
eukprot:gene35338-18595_t